MTCAWGPGTVGSLTVEPVHWQCPGQSVQAALAVSTLLMHACSMQAWAVLSVHRRQHTGGVSSMVCTSPVLAVQRVPGPHFDACTHTVHLRPWMLPACWQQPQGHAQAVSSVQRSVRQQRARAVCGGAAGVCSVQCTCRQLARSTGRGRAGCVPRTGHPCSALQHAQQAGCGAMPR